MDSSVDPAALEDIIYEKQNGVSRVLINRPQKANAFRLQTLREMTACFRDGRDDPTVGVIVLGSTGERAFCTGGEIEGELTIDAERRFLDQCMRLSAEIRGCGKPVIASAIDGYQSVVQHEQDGLLVPPADETALAVGLCRLLSDEALRRRLAAGGRAKAQTKPSTE